MITQQMYWDWLHTWAIHPRASLRGTLRMGEHFCPLGLLAHERDPEGWRPNNARGLPGTYTWQGRTSHLGILPGTWEHAVASLNDSRGKEAAYRYAWLTGPILARYGILGERTYVPNFIEKRRLAQELAGALRLIR